VIDESKNKFWLRHLDGVDHPLVHFIPSIWLDLVSLKDASKGIGFVVFLIDGCHVHSLPSLMDRFAEAMNFSIRFGRNWDALFDSMTDFSWNIAKGYVLILSNADSLLTLENNQFSVLVGVLEATIREWRDGRGEYAERAGPVPFHVVFSGSSTLREVLLRELKEPLCDHEAELSVRLVRAPQGICESETFRDSQKLWQSGADPELILVFLRDRGYSYIDSIYAAAALIEKSIPEAKTLVDHSRAWAAELDE
jgi:RNAse (barnase) inhibitor barstar